jgi:uncharacterized membrane-anchored protein YhcB (DUF1043 family)
LSGSNPGTATKPLTINRKNIMTAVIVFVAGVAVGFIVGVLVGRRNKNKVEQAVKLEQSVEKKITGK